MSKKPIEKKVADTVLQKSKPVIIGGKTYQVAPPTTATLILVSEEVAMLPRLEVNSGTDILSQALRIAKDCRFLGNILAILILGAKGITETKTVKEKKETIRKKFLGLVKQKQMVTVDKQVTVNRKEELAELLLMNKSPKELNELTAMLLADMEIGDFFGLTTSLIEINMIKPTREVVKMTASGL